jgi:hypothetical protein
MFWGLEIHCIDKKQIGSSCEKTKETPLKANICLLFRCSDTLIQAAENPRVFG